MADLIIDYTSRDFNSLREDLINNLTTLAPELTNKNESEFAIVLIDLFSYIGDILSYMTDRYANESFLSTAVEKENVRELASELGYTMGRPKPAKVDLQFTLASTNSVDVIIPAKTIVSTTSLDSPLNFETDEIAYIPAGDTQITVSATQGDTKEQTLGYSDGSENQKYELIYTPVLDDDNNSIEVYVDTQIWTYVDSFFNSTNIDFHFTLTTDNDKVWVEFGDGVNGYIPPNTNRIYAIYRVGSGKDGNVGANTITIIQNDIFDVNNDIVSISVTNPLNASGGQDEESIAQVKINAPKKHRANRAVTASDYNDLASTFTDSNYGSIVKAASFKNGSDPTQVDVYVWQLNPNDDSEVITPSASLKNSLKNYLDTISMVGVTNNIINGIIVDIDITATIYVEKNYSINTVQTNVENALNNFFDYKNIEIGQLVPISRIDSIISGIQGVSYVDRSLPAANIQLGTNEIAKIGTMILTYQSL